MERCLHSVSALLRFLRQLSFLGTSGQRLGVFVSCSLRVAGIEHPISVLMDFDLSFRDALGESKPPPRHCSSHSVIAKQKRTCLFALLKLPERFQAEHCSVFAVTWRNRWRNFSTSTRASHSSCGDSADSQRGRDQNSVYWLQHQ